MGKHLQLDEQHHSRDGVVYVAFGAAHLAMAILSAQTMRYFNPDLSIHFICNRPSRVAERLEFWNKKTDYWTEIDDDEKNNRIYKTGLHSFVKFDRAIYLDVDTLITGSLSLGFKYLDYFDVAARVQKDKQRHSHLADSQLLPGGLTVKDLPQWNGGVIFFKSNQRCKALFKNWQRLFDSIGEKYDQPALAKAMIESDCRILSLDERWNGGFRKMTDDKGGMPLVAHYHSALDMKIEKKLREIARLINTDISGDVNAEIESFIFQCREKRRRSEGLKNMVRRAYRIYWHYKYSTL